MYLFHWNSGRNLPLARQVGADPFPRLAGSRLHPSHPVRSHDVRKFNCKCKNCPSDASSGLPTPVVHPWLQHPRCLLGQGFPRSSTWQGEARPLPPDRPYGHVKLATVQAAAGVLGSAMEQSQPCSSLSWSFLATTQAEGSVSAWPLRQPRSGSPCCWNARRSLLPASSVPALGN